MLCASKISTMAGFKLWMLLCMLSVAHQPRAVKATDDVAGVSPCELESIINQLTNPNPEYQLHVSALRNQLRNMLRDRQLDVGEEQSLTDYDYPDEDKRSVASLAAQGLLRAGAKRSLATLAKNGQLPTPDPEDTDSTELNEDKRYVGSLARSGGFMGYGKRNVGSLARDFQLPQNGKRNLATLARLGLLSGEPKRNVAAVAKYNSNPHRYGGAAGGAAAAAEKRNLGALKGSPVHGGVQQKREESAGDGGGIGGNADYMDVASYWMYPSYADMDWGDFSGRMFQKRYLDTSKDPMLFGIENAGHSDEEQLHGALDAGGQHDDVDDDDDTFVTAQKRHIGAVYRSGFLPSYRSLRSTTGTGGGRFSRSGRARQFVEYFHQREPLRQPIAAVCKRCFLPYRPALQWSAAGVRGRLPKYYETTYDDHRASILTNALPSSQGRRPYGYVSTTSTAAAAAATTRNGGGSTNTENHSGGGGAFVHSWGTPPRITALHRRAYRRPDYDSAMNNYYN